MSESNIDVTAVPSGTGCAECMANGGWWFHLRRCTACGHIGCCDNSPEQHARHHVEATGHTVITSFEPGEDWFYDFATDKFVFGKKLAPPDSRPEDQPVPGPAGAVPDDWTDQLHD